MPPKAATATTLSKTNGENGKGKKVTAQQLALEAAESDARKLFKQHELQRVRAERADTVAKEHLLLDATVEVDRLRKERDIFCELQRGLQEEEQLAYKEHEKHLRWQHVPDASRLPDIHDESSINTFLSVWRETEQEYDRYAAETVVIASGSSVLGGNASTYTQCFVRGEQGLPKAKRRQIIDEELMQCLEAYKLTQAMKAERDVAALARQEAQVSFYNNSVCRVYEQVMQSLDFITVNALMYYDTVLDSGDEETLVRCVPEMEPVIKFGLWVKVKEMTRSFTSLVFPGVEVRLDPKPNALPKLPRALGLSKENVALRVVQLAFNPYTGYPTTGHEFYALRCTLKVDLLSFTDRPRRTGEWLLRGETAATHTLHCEAYAPHNAEGRIEDPGFRISFIVPPTLVIRQPTLLIGKWVPQTCSWEPCSHTTFGATFNTNNLPAEANPRRATFVTNELAHFAVLQEKVFDAPFEAWSLKPLSFDRVLVTVEGRRRGEASDREFRILVEDAACKLLTPGDAELEALREGWHEPATLLRELSMAGFCFVLDDEDAKYLDKVLPKTAELERKAYADMAQFCQYFAVASSRHNKFGEDPDMALFRLSRRVRAVDGEDAGFALDTDPAGWYGVRYRRTNCAICAFTEVDQEADLNILDGHETHYNLYAMLQPIYGEEVLRSQVTQTNYLLRRCVEQLLTLLRPLSWG